jgi:hypothetical protein
MCVMPAERAALPEHLALSSESESTISSASLAKSLLN